MGFFADYLDLVFYDPAGGYSAESADKCKTRADEPLAGLPRPGLGLGHVGCRHPLAGLLEVSLQLLVQAPIKVGRGDAPRDPHGRLVVGPFVPEELVAMWASPPCLWVYHLPGDAVGLSVRSARGWTGAAASALR